MKMELAAKPPFRLEAVVRSHGWYQLAPFVYDHEEKRLCTVTTLATGLVAALEITPAGSLVPPTRGVEVATSAELDADEQAQVRQQVTWMLDLDRDLSDFYAMARATPGLAHVEATARGRILRCPTFFEDVVKTILTTNTAWSGTKRMVNALVDELGALPSEPLDARASEARARHAFPIPEALADAGAARLRELGLGYRAPYVAQLGTEVANGSRDLAALKAAELPTEEVRRRLLDIQGIGPYASASLLLLLGRYDFLPIDSWARRMVSQEWYDGESVGNAEVEAAFQDFGQWKGVAYWFWEWSEG